VWSPKLFARRNRRFRDGLLGYVERDALEGIVGRIFEQIVAYANGQPINVVNPKALEEPRGDFNALV
jgi:hypothetical protein